MANEAAGKLGGNMCFQNGKGIGRRPEAEVGRETRKEEQRPLMH